MTIEEAISLLKGQGYTVSAPQKATSDTTAFKQGASSGNTGAQTNPWPNTLKAQAGAKPGDYIQTSKGVVQLSIYDINWAREKLGYPRVTEDIITGTQKANTTLNSTNINNTGINALKRQYKKAYDKYRKATVTTSPVNDKEALERLYAEYKAAQKKYRDAKEK